MAYLAHAQTTLSAIPVQTFFLPEIFKQTLQMIRDAQGYFEGRGKNDLAYLTQPIQLLYASEMSRVTMRLSCVMAWCLGQQALVRGEISEEDAATNFRLEGSDVCMSETNPELEFLPPAMRELIEESAMLYERTLRIDQQMGTEQPAQQHMFC